MVRSSPANRMCLVVLGQRTLFGALEKVSQAAHLCLCILKRMVGVLVLFCRLDNWENVLDCAVIVLAPEFPREMESVMLEKSLEDREVKIKTVASYLESVMLAHAEIAKAERL